MRGKILKAIGGFYDVWIEPGRVVRCRARGRFKKEGVTPLAGDEAELTLLTAGEGVLEGIMPRRSLLVRPAVANTDQVVIVCSPQDPPLSLQLLDRLLILAESQSLRPVICMNKEDLLNPGDALLLQDVYSVAGYPVVYTSALFGRGMEKLKSLLCGLTSVLAGPSGVGKSSLLNKILPGAVLKTGEVSEKLKRGRHTTRHVELLPLPCGGFVADTPGFSQLDLSGISLELLPECFPEFGPFAQYCRYRGCRHHEEPECAVKEAAQSGRIAGSRYAHYLVFLEEVAAQRRCT